jgi:hypothetical protein
MADEVAKSITTIVQSLGKSDMQSALGELEAMMTMARLALADQPDRLAELEASMAKQKNMMALVDDMEGAFAAGDTEKANEVRVLISAQSGMGDFYDGYPPEAKALHMAIDSSDDLGGVCAALPGVDLNKGYGKYESFPLSWAMRAETNRLELVEMLLNSGADATLATEEGYTPLHYVADSGYSETPVQSQIAALLVAAGGDIEARTHWGWTPLLSAVMEGSTEELAALLSVGADPNARYTDQSLPEFSRGLLAVMAAGYDTDKVQLLLDHGADPVGVSECGQTVLDYFIAEAARAQSNLDDPTAVADSPRFNQTYQAGYAASLALIRERLALRH